MGLKNILIAVSDIEKSKQFYHELFGLNVICDFGENVILSEGLVLQSKDTWEKLLESDISMGNAFELFFEEYSLDTFLSLLEKRKDVKIIKDVYENSWNKRCIRFADPDGHIIEVAEK